MENIGNIHPDNLQAYMAMHHLSQADVDEYLHNNNNDNDDNDDNNESARE